MLQLYVVIDEPHLLTWLEGRQPDVGASIAPKRIAQRAVAATAHFPLYCEVELVEVVCA